MSGGCGKCALGLCGEGKRGCRPQLPSSCLTSGGCFLKRRAPHFCCRPASDCPQSCPPPLPRCSPQPIPLPLCCHPRTMESCANDFIIYAIRTACRPKATVCSDAPCGAKGTIINFLVPNTGIPRRSTNRCSDGR